jgi:hypothetical protein
VGDWGGEETLAIVKSLVLVLWPRRRAPATDGGEEGWLIGAGPTLGTNFLLKDGTLKFGAGGDALRVNVSGISVEGWAIGIGSVREVEVEVEADTEAEAEPVGPGDERGDIYSD